MKKFFSLFTALLFVGTMFAANYELMLTLDVTQGAPSGTTSTALSSSDLLSYLQGAAPESANITAAEKISGDIYKGKGSGGSGIPQACLKIGKASGGGSFSFTIASTFDNVAKVELVGYGWKTDTKVAVNSSATQSPQTAASEVTFPYVLSTASKTITIAVTSSAFCATQIKLYKEVAPTEPTISANDINFGTVYVPNGTSYTHQYELAVTGTQLDNAITYESSDDAKVAVSGTLTATGGTLTLDVTAPHGDFAETITLTSGTVKKVVNVTGTVQSKYATPISVAEALAAYEAGTLLAGDSLQVRGLVKSSNAIYTTSATVVITDVDDAEKEFTLYSIKSINKANFASFDDGWTIDVNGVKFAAGDTVAASGKVTTFGTPAKPQIASGGYLVEVTRDKATIVPEITASPKSISLASYEAAEDQVIALAYAEWSDDATSATATLYSDADCTAEITLGGWVSNFAFNADFTELTFDVSENTVTTARTAYILIVAENDDEEAEVVVAISQAAAPTLDTYKPIALADIQSTDVVIIAMKDDDTNKIYALSTEAATGANAKATEVTSLKSGDNLSVYSNAEIFWTIADSTSGYVLYPNGETKRWLTGTSSNANTRINTGASKFWTINKNYLYNTGVSKHLGVYVPSTDWRCYAPSSGNVHANISGETLCFYVKDGGEGTSLSNTAVENKAVKFIENGQLIINLNGVHYNALGERIR